LAVPLSDVPDVDSEKLFPLPSLRVKVKSARVVDARSKSAVLAKMPDLPVKNRMIFSTIHVDQFAIYDPF
jgi:hypothetical protein